MDLIVLGLGSKIIYHNAGVLQKLARGWESGKRSGDFLIAVLRLRMVGKGRAWFASHCGDKEIAAPVTVELEPWGQDSPLSLVGAGLGQVFRCRRGL